MAIDFSSQKVQTFSGINDAPQPPTSTKGGNGSHLISLYNALIDTLSQTLNSHDSSIQQLDSEFNTLSNTVNQLSQGTSNSSASGSASSLWLVKTDSYNLNIGENVIAFNGAGRAIILTLPSVTASTSVPNAFFNAEFAFINTNPSVPVQINFSSGEKFNGDYNGGGVTFSVAFQKVSLIFSGGDLGFLSSEPNVFTPLPIQGD